MAETDSYFYESFENSLGSLNHLWAGSVDQSVQGEIKLTGFTGIMERSNGTSSGHGYGTYKFDARIEGNELGPVILLWPGDDKWPGQEINVVEVMNDGSGRQYATVHWDEGGNAYEYKIYDNVQSGQFHEYELTWQPGRLTFRVDGSEKAVFTDHVPADYDNGGMNNTIGFMNINDNTSLTVRSMEYSPLG